MKKKAKYIKITTNQSFDTHSKKDLIFIVVSQLGTHRMHIKIIMALLKKGVTQFKVRRVNQMWFQILSPSLSELTEMTIIMKKLNSQYLVPPLYMGK